MPVKLLEDGNKRLHDGALQDGASTRVICVEKHGLEQPPSPHHEFVTIVRVGPELLKSSCLIVFSHSGAKSKVKNFFIFNVNAACKRKAKSASLLPPFNVHNKHPSHLCALVASNISISSRFELSVFCLAALALLES